MMLRILPVGALILAAACTPEHSVSGRQAYEEDCAACHGMDAKGGGSFGQQLITVPPDLTGLSARNGGVFPLDYVMSTIDGLHRDAGFSAAMPEFGAGDMGETVMVGSTPVPARLLALAGYLESLQE
jgi:mono/diheme cytochrome c family protein